MFSFPVPIFLNRYLHIHMSIKTGVTGDTLSVGTKEYEENTGVFDADRYSLGVAVFTIR